jgi:hypothetical protein
MTDTEVNLKLAYESLCYYDPRNPDNVIDEEDIDRQPREKGCGCDNCFRGKDGLALIIIRLEMVKIAGQILIK